MNAEFGTARDPPFLICRGRRAFCSRGVIRGEKGGARRRIYSTSLFTDDPSAPSASELISLSVRCPSKLYSRVKSCLEAGVIERTSRRNRGVAGRRNGRDSFSLLTLAASVPLSA